MTKFDLDTSKSLCKSTFDHWRKAGKTDTNRGYGRKTSHPSDANIGQIEVPKWLPTIGFVARDQTMFR